MKLVSMTKNINIRLDDDIIKDLDLISQWEETYRTYIIRQLLRKSITIRKLEYAAKLYQEKKASIGKAVDIANVSLWEFQD